jgi:hypothetical protein
VIATHHDPRIETGNAQAFEMKSFGVDAINGEQANGLAHLTVLELLELHADVLAELRRREIVRSANNPVGDYGELLFARAFDWKLAPKSEADADATDADGRRYQIKCRRLATPEGSRQMGFIRRLPAPPFDFLAAVLLDAKFRVLRGAIIPYELVLSQATPVSSVNAWRFILRDSVWQGPGVHDATERLRSAETVVGSITQPKP